ncbi:MAG: 2-hydroxychromene-2-carboxylate isomerase [Burkholderiales bacterium]|nr:2-hydroxychromene-2-carboxylate isomerase [Burkholderiales bacterium]
MSAPLIFHFDFSSPYGYLASTKIDALGARHGRDVIWKPFLIGATLKVTGLPVLMEVPLKGDYSRHDFARSARFHGVSYNHPDPFPISTQAPARAFYWVAAQDPVRAKQLAVALLQAYFVEGINISNPADTVAVAKGLGHDAAALEAALNDPAVKALLKDEVDAAMGKGVFGSPFVFVDGEPFWGIDRFDQIERWLATGGF